MIILVKLTTSNHGIRTSLILQENELDQYICKEVLEPEGDERIFADSIKDHLIPHVSSLKTPKEVFNVLTKLFEGKDNNQKMTLRNQLKNVKMPNLEAIQSYFTRVAQIKEQLESVEDNVMITLNGLPRSWDSFIQGICAIRNMISFSRLWEECTQE